MERYQLEGCIGEGIHGLVFKAKSKESGELVAIKKVGINIGDNDISCSCFQELKSLQHLEHRNVTRLLEYFPHGSSLVLVLEFMTCDLQNYLRDPEVMVTASRVKGAMRMLLRGLAYCHRKRIVHRDLKPANLLIGRDGVLRIGDFGQARLFDSDENTARLNSHQVATRWYRAPELLYGSQDYKEGVDLWAAGCILAELINRFPLFRGENDIDQLCVVLQGLGTPDPETWPGLEQLPDYHKILFPNYETTPWTTLVPDADSLATQLLTSFLCYSADRRMPAQKALHHRYFFSEPLPCQSLPLKDCQ